LVAALLLVILFIGVPLGVHIVFRYFRQRIAELDERWKREIATLAMPATLEAFRRGPALLGGLSVTRYTPGQYLELSSEDSETGSSPFQFLIGGVFIIVGIVIFWKTWTLIDTTAARVAAALFSLALGGAGVYAIFFISPPRSVRFDASRRVFETSRSEKIRARTFSDFTAVVMREGPIRVGRTPQGMAWFIELQPQSGLRVYVTLSEGDFDREGSFQNAAPLAKAIAAIMRLPVRVKTNRYQHSWR
jgi:hypothetical protein